MKEDRDRASERARRRRRKGGTKPI